MTERRRSDGRDERPSATGAGGEVTGDGFDGIELGLRRDDPAFVRRMHRLTRASRRNAVAVVVSLLASAVLLTVALGTQSLTALLGGGVALMAAFTSDGHHRRRFGSD